MIWTRVVMSISYDDNHYTTGTSYSEPGSKGNEGVLHISLTVRLYPHYQMQFNVIPRTQRKWQISPKNQSELDLQILKNLFRNDPNSFLKSGWNQAKNGGTLAIQRN